MTLRSWQRLRWVLALMSITTLANADPTLLTTSATSITDTSATLNGTVNGNGDDIPAVYFDYGPTIPYAHLFVNATPFNVTAAQGETAVSLAIGGLTCGTTYHFRVAADDFNGRPHVGNDLTFVTSPCPLPPKEVPTLSEWALLGLSGLLAWAAGLRLGRNRHPIGPRI